MWLLRGHPQGVPLRDDWVGWPVAGLAGCPYGTGRVGGTGHPQVVPLRGDWVDRARLGCGLGHPQVVPLQGDWVGWPVAGLRAWAPTRGASTGGLGWLARCRVTGLATHEGCPYGAIGLVGPLRVGGPGHPQGAPLRGGDFVYEVGGRRRSCLPRPQKRAIPRRNRVGSHSTSRTQSRSRRFWGSM